MRGEVNLHQTLARKMLPIITTEGLFVGIYTIREKPYLDIVLVRIADEPRELRVQKYLTKVMKAERFSVFTDVIKFNALLEDL